MKKAKMMLAALGVVAIAGATLAFTVKGTGFYVLTLDEANNTCKTVDALKKISTTSGGVIYEQVFTTTNPAVTTTATAACTVPSIRVTAEQ